MKTILLLISILTASGTTSAKPQYLIEYDFPGHGDDWYGHSNPSRQNLDYSQFTDIKTQQGDDFCNGYEPSIVHFSQGPELARTQNSHYSYNFKYTDGTLCLSYTPPLPPPDPIFANGFEN